MSCDKQSYALDKSISIFPIEPDLSSSLCRDCSNRNEAYCIEWAFQNPRNNLFRNLSMYSLSWP